MRRTSFRNAGFHLFAAVNSTVAAGNGEPDAGCLSLLTFFRAYKESMAAIGAVTPRSYFVSDILGTRPAGLPASNFMIFRGLFPCDADGSGWIKDDQQCELFEYNEGFI